MDNRWEFVIEADVHWGLVLKEVLVCRSMSWKSGHEARIVWFLRRMDSLTVPLPIDTIQDVSWGNVLKIDLLLNFRLLLLLALLFCLIVDDQKGLTILLLTVMAHHSCGLPFLYRGNLSVLDAIELFKHDPVFTLDLSEPHLVIDPMRSELIDHNPLSKTLINESIRHLP